MSTCFGRNWSTSGSRIRRPGRAVLDRVALWGWEAFVDASADRLDVVVSDHLTVPHVLKDVPQGLTIVPPDGCRSRRRDGHVHVFEFAGRNQLLRHRLQ